MKRKSQPQPSVSIPETIAGPWKGVELRSFWAACRLAHINRTAVDNMIAEHFGRGNLTDLTRREWLGLFSAIKEFVRPLRRAALEPKDPRHGRANEDQWARVRWLQGRLGWTDEHRDAYIRKHGHIDNIAWMTVPIARAIITGMEKILAWREKQEMKGGSTCQS